MCVLACVCPWCCLCLVFPVFGACMTDSSGLCRQSTHGTTARDNREYVQRLKQALAGDTWALQRLKDAATLYRCALS